MRTGLPLAACAAAAAAFVFFTVPPARLALGDAGADGTIAGILHVHTTRSDGRDTADEIAAAAARAGLEFVVLTDHGDATRTPDPPAYRAGVLCLDAVEISTTGGHYLALGLGAAPYPLGGEARDVVEDVRRLGGFGVAAHPDSPKEELRWRDWDLPVDGVETLNPDTSWRHWAYSPGVRPKLRLLEGVLSYPARPAETIANLLRAENIRREWTDATRHRRVVTLAGADAHAKLALVNADPGNNTFTLPLPSYEASFAALSVRVRLAQPLTGDAAADAELLLRALRAGHAYSAVNGLASPPSLVFTATNASGTAAQGDELRPNGPVTLHVRTNAPPSFTTTVWNGASVVSGDRHEPTFEVTVADGAGVFWVEVRAPTAADVPWITSNPIYVRAPAVPAPRPARQRPTVRSIFDGKAGVGWTTEHDRDSLAVLDVAPTLSDAELRLRFGLLGGPAVGQYVALVVDVPGGTVPGGKLTFTARAERPMRVSVQLRGVGQQGGIERWQRSVYLDTTTRERSVEFDDLVPVGRTATPLPVFPQVQSIMFIVDTTNTKPGTSGRFWITSASIAH